MMTEEQMQEEPMVEENKEKIEEAQDTYYEEPEEEQKIDHAKDIKEAVALNKVIIGLDEVKKALKAENITKLYVAKNIPEDRFNELKHFADIANIEIVKLNIPNDELGILCKKQYMISVLAFRKQ